MRSLNIALVTDGIYPFVLGGMQKHSFYLTKYLARAKINVDVYHFFASDDITLEEAFKAEELNYISFYKIEYPKKKFFPGHYLYERFLYSKNILKYLNTNISAYDFVYCKGFAGWALLTQKDQLKNVPPVGVNFHGFEMFQRWPTLTSGLQLQLLKWPVKLLTRKADYVFSYGGKVTDIIVEKVGVESSKVIEIPSGISQNWLISERDIIAPGEVIKFVFVGRFERRKGIEEMHHVISQLSTLYNYEFHFIGPIPDNKKLQHNFIHYHGVITDTSQLQQLLRKMDVLVCPSHSEGMPNVILEGMASGLAIIATDVGATSLLVKDNGWLIQANNIKLNLLHAMKAALEVDDYTLHEMKNKSVEIIEKNFLWEKVIKDTIQEINRVIRH